jgi:hypothetical protein
MRFELYNRGQTRLVSPVPTIPSAVRAWRDYILRYDRKVSTDFPRWSIALAHLTSNGVRYVVSEDAPRKESRFEP